MEILYIFYYLKLNETSKIVSAVIVKARIKNIKIPFADLVTILGKLVTFF